MTWLPRGIVIILSDLFDNVDAMMAGLKHFRHRRHEVIIMHVLDPAEVDFPFEQATLFRGLELGDISLGRDGRTLIVTRAEVFAVKDGKETLLGTTNFPILILALSLNKNGR